MVTKKKAKKNEDFKKVKLKVGKKLKKTTTTDTTIKARKVVLAQQLEEKIDSEDKPLSFRGLTLDDLSKQLGHFNKNIRNSAIIGLKQILTSRPDLITIHLRTLIPSIARLMSDNSLEPSHRVQLKALLRVICTVPSQTMSAHITLFLAHVFRALSHMELPIRNFALSILSTLMSSYPELCRNNPDLFPSFINFLGSSRKPLWNKPGFLDTILSFVNVFDVSRRKQIQEIDLKINFEDQKFDEKSGDLKNVFYQSEGQSPFDFTIMTSSKATSVSPFELPSALLNLNKVLAPLITTSILEDTGGTFLPQTTCLIESIVRAAENQSNDFLLKDFRQQVIDSMDSVRKAILKRKGKSDKLRNAAKWLIVE
ncbi:unnamed protein product [Caenorhabditis angaria]|uniref:Pre-rRNA-processing protein Ipi1 N-terminal domain-containing protein n=1 Tax=Caenorhabditis angaria TaxID=860376 RepID=A0A9P1IIW4_9PELO|nr:unnamed protein product [Caenorhabditis angaria]